MNSPMSSRRLFESSSAACLLPSNAGRAPSSFAYEPTASPTILQELSSNSQQDGFQRSQRRSHRLPKRDNVFSNEDHRGVPSAVYSRATVITASPEPGRIYHRPEVSPEVYKFLCDRRWKCEAYVKYRNGQKKDARSEKELQKWPPHMEEVFFKALIHHDPRGRKKIRPDDRGGRPLPEGLRNKILGRNEQIALFIDDWFGFIGKHEEINRKRISSHLQVLKGYFRNEKDKNVLWYLGGLKLRDPPWKMKRAIPLQSPMEPSFARSIGGLTAFSSPYHPQFPSLQPSMLPQPLNVLPSQAIKKFTTVLEPYEFRMYVQKCRSKVSNHDCNRSPKDCRFGGEIHSITESQKDHHMPPNLLDETLNWQCHFPPLERMQRDGELNCDILFAQATLAVPTDQLLNCTLSIESEFRTQLDPARIEQWQCRTQFFENDNLKEIFDDGETEDSKMQIATDKANPQLLSISFGSQYWARKFEPIAARLRCAAKSGTGFGGSARDRQKKVEEEVRNEIKNITAVQEVFVKEPGLAQRKRVSILYWKFRKTQIDEIGITTWRTLIPPRIKEAGSGMVELEDLDNATIGVDFDDLNKHALVVGNPSLHPQPLEPTLHHDLDLLSTAALFDPSLYAFDLVDPNNRTTSPSSNHSITANTTDPTTCGAVLPHLDFAAFDMPLPLPGDPDHPLTLAHHCTTSTPLALHACDPTVLDGTVDTPPRHVQQHMPDYSFALRHPMDNSFLIDHASTQYHPYHHHVAAQESVEERYQQPQQLRLEQQQRYVYEQRQAHEHHYPSGFEALFGGGGGGNGAGVATWAVPAPREQQQQRAEREQGLLYPAALGFAVGEMIRQEGVVVEPEVGEEMWEHVVPGRKDCGEHEWEHVLPPGFEGVGGGGQGRSLLPSVI